MKKFLLIIATLIIMVCSCLLLVACNDNGGGDDARIIEVYNSYVVYAQENGVEPLSYEDWLSTIKGEKGDKGDKGDQGQDGITPTIEISEDGYWIINGIKTEYVALENFQFRKIPGREEYAVVGFGTISSSDIVIPSTYRGLPVTRIAKYFFEPEESYGFLFTSIVIPESIIEINYVRAIQYSVAIFYCEAKEKPAGWEIDLNNYAPVIWDYKNNDVADDGNIYTTIDGIRYGLSNGEATVVTQIAKNMTSANIPTAVIYNKNAYVVNSIGEEAFKECELLQSLNIPSTVTSIGERAFYKCSSLTSIVIPSSVTSIDYAAFDNCSSLTSVFYKGSKEDWDNISIESSNYDLEYATRYYYVENESDLPDDDGNYWHYVDGVPTVWVKE